MRVRSTAEGAEVWTHDERHEVERVLRLVDLLVAERDEQAVRNKLDVPGERGESAMGAQNTARAKERTGT